MITLIDFGIMGGRKNGYIFKIIKKKISSPNKFACKCKFNSWFDPRC